MNYSFRKHGKARFLSGRQSHEDSCAVGGLKPDLPRIYELSGGWVLWYGKYKGKGCKEGRLVAKYWLV
jgi:hypothetical protein